MTRRRLPLMGAFAVLAVLLGFAIFTGGDEPANAPAMTKEREGSRVEEDRPPPLRRFRRISSPRAEVRDDAASKFGAVAGVVLDWDTESPVGGAEVTFMDEAGAHSVLSDARGRFELDAPSPGAYALASVLADGYQPYAPALGQSPIQFVPRRGQTVDGVAIYLVPELVVHGLVIDGDGNAVPGASVRTLGVGTGEAALADTEASYTSDSRGHFEVSAPLGTVLEGFHPEHGAGRAQIDERALATRSLTIALDREAAPGDGELAGTVVNERGQPVTGARVVAGTSALATVGETVTDEAGAFTIRELRQGSYRVEASHPDYAPIWTPPLPTGSMSIALHLSAGGSIEGTIRDHEGAMVAGAAVVALRHSGELLRIQQAHVTVFDAEGSYRITGLPPGRYDVVGSARDRAPDEVTGVEVDASAVTVNLRLGKGSTIAGRVVDEETGRALAAARVEIERAIGHGPSVAPMFSSAITGSDGSFELHGIENGRHSIVAYAREHVPRVLSGIEVEGQDIGPITLELAPGDAGGGAFDIVGIGVQVSASEADLRIVDAVPGGGADRAGIQAGDRIIAVDGLPVSEYDFSGAVEALRGMEGTAVSLTVSRGDEVFEVEAIRARVRG